MRWAKLQVVTLAVLIGAFWLLVPDQAEASPRQREATQRLSRKAKAKRAAPPVQPAQPEPEAPPPPPPTPEQMPATPPEVTYRDQQLIIVARNSTLSDILNAVRHSTGAEFDVPDTATERVVGRFGPGPARDVLAKLLNGSRFNYVMVGTVNDPNAVSHVILTPNTGGVTPPSPSAQPPSFQQAALPPTAPPVQTSTEPADEDQGDSTDQGTDAAEENGEDQETGETQNPNQPAVKTPEQLLQELQRQQQLMQQQQQQQLQGQPVQVQPGQRPQLIFSNPPQEKPQE
jgi:hypothetical protein